MARQEAMTPINTVGIETVSAADLGSEKLRRLHELWADLKGSGKLPRRGDLEPEQLGSLLGWVTIVEVRQNPLEFSFRLVGTKVEDAGRRGDQGRTLDEIQPEEYCRMIGEAYEQVLETGLPVFMRVGYPHGRSVAGFERAVFPFSLGGDAIGFLLDCLDWPFGVEQDLANFSLSKTPPSR